MSDVSSISESESAFAGPVETLFRRSVLPTDAWATLAIIHGYGDHSGRYLHFMRWLAQRGVASHAVDLRGQGRASGRRGFVRRWEDYLDDVDAFLALPEFQRERSTFLLGHSHGGLVVAATVERGVSAVRGCILTAPFFSARIQVPWHKKVIARLMNPLMPWLRVASGLSDDMLTSDEAMRAESHADPLLTRSATPRWYIGSLDAQRRALIEADRFTLPLLLLFGGIDPVAHVETARRFFDAAASIDKTMNVHPGLLHEILRETSRERVFEEILEWMKVRSVPSCPTVGGAD
jgi:alpha-beta hydrolase superfamily lysophospholipase